MRRWQTWASRSATRHTRAEKKPTSPISCSASPGSSTPRAERLRPACSTPFPSLPRGFAAGLLKRVKAALEAAGYIATVDMETYDKETGRTQIALIAETEGAAYG